MHPCWLDACQSMQRGQRPAATELALHAGAGSSSNITTTHDQSALLARCSGNWSPKIDHMALNLAVAITPQPLLPHAPGQAIYVGVNSFGIGGSNAFCVLRDADSAPHLAPASAPPRALQLAAAPASKPLPAYILPLSSPQATQVGWAAACSSA